MTFGSHATASMLSEHFDNKFWLPGTFGRQRRKPAPKGFSFIGDGAFRDVYLERATGIVYKLGNADTNLSEVDNAKRLLSNSRWKNRLIADVRIPRTKAFRVKDTKDEHGYNQTTYVIAQQYVPKAKPTSCEKESDFAVIPCTCGRTPCFADVRASLQYLSALTDLHDGNVLVDAGGVFWIVDLGN